MPSLYADDAAYTDMPSGLSASGIAGVAGFADEPSQNLVSDMRSAPFCATWDRSRL